MKGGYEEGPVSSKEYRSGGVSAPVVPRVTRGIRKRSCSVGLRASKLG